MPISSNGRAHALALDAGLGFAFTGRWAKKGVAIALQASNDHPSVRILAARDAAWSRPNVESRFRFSRRLATEYAYGRNESFDQR
jgi:hypothetical protein